MRKIIRFKRCLDCHHDGILGVAVDRPVEQQVGAHDMPLAIQRPDVQMMDFSDMFQSLEIAAVA